MNKKNTVITPYIILVINVIILVSTISVVLMDLYIKHQFNINWLLWNLFILYIVNKNNQ